MRASLIIPAHNEGDALSRTVDTCIETTGDLDYEIIVADDGSTDGSVEQVERRFAKVSVARQGKRLGVSPARVLGARHARGEVLLFLDGHTKPEVGALEQLVADVEETNGQAVLTPQIPALDVGLWVNDPSQKGHGFGMDLQTLECRWLELKDMRAVREGRREYYESPALIGCALAVGRELYNRLGGFDAGMLFWGVEDLDFALKCWLMGYRVLHDPHVIIGHRFRTRFDNYDVPTEHVIVNQLRLARKHFTQAVWENWVEGQRELQAGPLAGQPQGLWAHGWHLFHDGKESVEQERRYLQGRRVRDEFWYAERFGLSWPRLESKAVSGARALTGMSPSPQPSKGPSPSPPPGCQFQVSGPQNVPGLSSYTYQMVVPAGQTPTNISWQIDRPTATFSGPVNQTSVIVNFANTAADWITLRANFVLNGKNQCAQVQIALVKVDVGSATFTRPAKASGTASGNLVFLVNPPAPPAVPTWVTTHDPGSACAAFTYNGSNQAAEPRVFVSSNGGGGGAAFQAQTTVTLTSPTQKPTALQSIQIGFIQQGSDSGSATYATTPAGKQRTTTIPTTETVDWLTTPCSPAATDDWPWYDQTSQATGTGSGTWTQTLTMIDSPSFGFPAQYNPNNPADPNTTKAIISGADSLSFVIRIGVRTTDASLNANTHYFDEAHSTWSANFVWPVPAGTSIITTGPDWTKPAGPAEISVNVVPTSTNHNAPFLRVIPG